MKYPALIATDLHLTANARDEYRWKILELLGGIAERGGFRTIVILGDLTDYKDKHPASLVNRLVRALSELSRYFDIVILKGNHDYLLNERAFFEFLNELEGVRFITDPVVIDGDLWMPHTRDAELWHVWAVNGPYRNVFMHQTISGALASNGQRMEGDISSVIEAQHFVISGDIHVPQTINGVEYVGSPYHVHFGDNFDPRILLMRSPLSFEGFITEAFFPKRVSVKGSKDHVLEWMDQHLDSQDQVVLKVQMQEAEASDWPQVRALMQERCKARGFELCGLELELETRERLTRRESATYHKMSFGEALEAFATKERIGGRLLEVGRDLLHETQPHRD